MRQDRNDGLVLLFMFILLLMACLYIGHILTDVQTHDMQEIDKVATVMKCVMTSI